MIYVLVAMIVNHTFTYGNSSGVIQIEFDSLSKCEESKKVIEGKFKTLAIECLEIKK